MDAIIGTNTVSLAAADTAPLTGTPGYATNGNPGVTNPTPFPAYHYNTIIQELLALIEGAGITQSSYTLTQIFQSVKRMAGGNVTTVTPTANTTLTADNAGLVLVNAAAGNVAITLPLANSAGGRPIYFDFIRTDTSGNTVTITDAGSDVDQPAGVTSLSLGLTNALSMAGNGVNGYEVLASAASLFGTIVQKNSGTYVVQPADNCSMFVLNNANLTFPATSGIAAGFRFGVTNGIGTPVITVTGSLVLAGNTVTTTVPMPNIGDFGLFEWDGSYWRCFGGSPDVLGGASLANYTKGGSTSITLPSATAANGTVGSSGWSKDPSGLIRQWAYIQLDDSNSTTWTFPIAFAAAPLKIRGQNFGIAAGQGGNGSVDVGGIVDVAGVPSNTSVSLVIHNTGTNGTLVVCLVEAEGY